MTTDETINLLVKKIVTAVHPIQIILFGSVVRHGLLPDSDIDVMVVMPSGTHRRHTAQELYRQIKGLKVPFDIIVVTPDDLKQHKDNIGLIYGKIIREGKEVYAA